MAKEKTRPTRDDEIIIDVLNQITKKEEAREKRIRIFEYLCYGEDYVENNNNTNSDIDKGSLFDDLENEEYELLMCKGEERDPYSPVCDIASYDSREIRDSVFYYSQKQENKSLDTALDELEERHNKYLRALETKNINTKNTNKGKNW